jgi:NAD+ kinase
MAMPIDLVLVRHGESESNLASKASKRGDTSLHTPEFRARHNGLHRLTAKGRRQAAAAGAWLRANGYGEFDRRYVSDYVRAKETAGLLGVDGPGWFVDPLLREREWGKLDGAPWPERNAHMAKSLITKDTDPFYWIPPGGESIAHLTTRLRPLFDTLHRECSQHKVLVVAHGEVMWALRFMLERMTVQAWSDIENSTEPGVKIYNCQVLHYTRRNPKTGEITPHLGWMRSVSPADEANSGPGWVPIVRRRFSNEELLESVDKTAQPLFGPQQGNV